MMGSAEDFEKVRKDLFNLTIREVIDLKNELSDLTEEELLNDDYKLASACGRIFQALDGIRKLNAVMSYFDAWEENGDLPGLSKPDELDTIKTFL